MTPSPTGHNVIDGTVGNTVLACRSACALSIICSCTRVPLLASRLFPFAVASASRTVKRFVDGPYDLPGQRPWAFEMARGDLSQPSRVYRLNLNRRHLLLLRMEFTTTTDRVKRKIIDSVRMARNYRWCKT